MVRAPRLIVAIVGAASLSLTAHAQTARATGDNQRAHAALASTRAEAAAVPN